MERNEKPVLLDDLVRHCEEQDKTVFNKPVSNKTIGSGKKLMLDYFIKNIK